MTASKRVALVAAFLAAASTLSASQPKPIDLTGVWTGSLNRTDGSSTAYLDLKQKDAELTGTAGPDADRQTPIAHGKVATVKDITSVTFDATQPSGAVMKFDLKIVEDRLMGKVTLEQNGQTKGEAILDVGRKQK